MLKLMLKNKNCAQSYQICMNTSLLTADNLERLFYQGILIYCKQQILRGTKLSRFTGFQRNVGKTVTILLNYNTYLNEPLNISRQNFCILSKIRENRKSFVPRRICCLRYAVIGNGCSIRVYQSFVAIMLALCLMLLVTYYAQCWHNWLFPS